MRHPTMKIIRSSTLDQRIAVGMPCHKAILDGALPPEMLDQKERDDGEGENDGKTKKAPGLAIAVLLLLLIIPAIHAALRGGQSDSHDNTTSS
jgi:hypothetical protein